MIGRLATVNFTFGFLPTSRRAPAGPRAPAGSPPPSAWLSAASPKAPGSPLGTQPRLPWAGRTRAQPLRSSRGKASGPRRGGNAGFNFANLPRDPRSLRRRRGQRRDPRAAASPARAQAVALSAPSCLHLPPPPPLKNSSIGAKQTFCCHLLSTARFQWQHLTQEPGGVGSSPMGPGARGWAAGSSSGAGLLPSVQLQHPAGEERGREARMQGRREEEERAVGGEGAGAARQSACAPRAGEPLAGLGPRGHVPPRAAAGVTAPSLPGRPGPVHSPGFRAHRAEGLGPGCGPGHLGSGASREP